MIYLYKRLNLKPVPKGRPRMNRSGHTYTPPKTKLAEKLIREAIIDFAPDFPVRTAVKLSLVFYCPMAKSWSKKKKNALMGKPHIQKADLDNLIKLVKDSLQAYVSDDCVVSTVIGHKYYWDNAFIDIKIEDDLSTADNHFHQYDDCF